MSHLLAYSKAGIEERGGHVGSTETDHVTITNLVTIGNALSKFGDRVNHGTSDAANHNDVLIWVRVVSELGQLCGDLCDRAMGVHNVRSLSQANISKVELGRVLWNPDLIGVQDGEAIADHVCETTSAVFVEVGGATVDDSEQHGLVEGGFVADKFLSLIWGDISLLELLRSQPGLGEVWLSHGAMFGRLYMESVDIDAFLYLQKSQ